jgi:thioredoxin reductase
MRYDVIIIGGSYAGMAAALQLVRARRTVLVIDAGLRRNRFAHESHGFLGQDGAAPAEIARQARDQLMAYPTLTWIDGHAEEAQGTLDAFTVTNADGTSYKGRRLLFATGVSDTLPKVEGIAERWGKSVFHCPYCHGYELNQGRIGVIATGSMSLHQALFLTEWGEVTLLANSTIQPDEDQRAQFSARGITIEEQPIVRLEGHADVRVTDGRLLTFSGLFTATRTSLPSLLAEGLGCDLEETALGFQIRTDATKETPVLGAFACGDAARTPHSVSLAVGDGAWAGLQVHRSLVF